MFIRLFSFLPKPEPPLKCGTTSPYDLSEELANLGIRHFLLKVLSTLLPHLSRSYHQSVLPIASLFE